MFYVCILYSKKRKRFYTGQCEDVGERFIYHNDGYCRSTRSGKPWRLVYAESFETRSEAVRREGQIKKMKSSRYIRKLILEGK
ncbi:GIY-YIG nuclease family protein [Balneola sp. MJW-20]|uniref:GIY-YIG nuclease family protein n=1 Tax=Gracilimonas aurantiaca TaxID=3234185 RepID=UPI0034674C3F